MSFKFNFGKVNVATSDSNINEIPDNSADEAINPEELDECPEHYRPCVYHKPTYPLNTSSELPSSSVKVSDHELHYINPDVATEKVQQDSEISSFLNATDLESGRYEGGLKVWECTYDLLQYLSNNRELMIQKLVVDLGCGAGLLGWFSYLNGSKRVCLQDYNSEVVENFTIPTIQKNLCEMYRTGGNSNNDRISSNSGCSQTGSNDCLEKFEFISGDWGNISEQFKRDNHDRFDLILSSETIYNMKYYNKIRDFLHEHMASDGIALFAAKTHYFGVGGGTHEFVKFLSENNGFQTDTVLKIDSGVSREILRIQKI